LPVTTTTSGPGTTTTGSPTTTSWPASWQPTLRYQQVVDLYNLPCEAPCSCYGVNDPCFLEGGEILSECLVLQTTTTTSTTTTTPFPPGTGVCTIANVLSYLQPGSYRAVSWKNGYGGWQICQDCPEGQIPLFRLGSFSARDLGRFVPVAIYDSPCVPSPCVDNPNPFAVETAGFVAYSFFDQNLNWGAYPESSEIVSSDGETFVANWVQCQTCPEGKRPAYAPPMRLYFELEENAPGVELIAGSGIYRFQVPCVDGPPCDLCEYSPVSMGLENATTLPPSETTTSTTTQSPSSTTTTTQAPCGCEPPPRCPIANNECVRTLCRPGGAALGTPACPLPTTNSPSQCVQPGSLKVCDCGSTTTTTTSTTSTTASPCTGSCSYTKDAAGRIIAVDTCGFGCRCDVDPDDFDNLACGETVTGSCVPGSIGIPGLPPCNRCDGTCLFLSRADYIDNAWVYRWQLYTSQLTGLPCRETLDGRIDVGCGSQSCTNDQIWGNFPSSVCCGCPYPATEPTSLCDITETSCGFGNQPTECSCCTTQPCDKYCSFKGNNTGGWTKIDDPCPTTCPCPAGPSSPSQSDCDLRRYACGSVIPTTTAGPTTSTTTTTPGPGACCLFGGCEFVPYAWCQQLRGSFQGAGVTCVSASCPTTTTTTVTTTQAPTGQCCYTVLVEPSGYQTLCIDGVSQSACYALHADGFPGFQWTQGGTCNPGACGSQTTTTTTSTTTTTTSTTPAPIGRCCYGFPYRNVCTSGMTQAQCQDLNGLWAIGQTCGESPCVGLCCSSDYEGGCIAGVSPDECSQGYGGFFAMYTDLGCGSFPNACQTTTTTTTTTSGPAPCAGAECTYQSLDGSTWTLMEACASPCNCPTPANPPAFEGDVATLNCVSP
jgi:hypothetical protein